MRSAIWAATLLGLLAPSVALGTTDDAPPEPKPPLSLRQKVLLKVEYGDGPGTLSVVPGAEGELPFGPTRVFEDAKGQIYVYDFNTGSLKTFIPGENMRPKTYGHVEGAVDDGPGVLLVDKQGNTYFYCGSCAYGDSFNDSDYTNVRKTTPTGETVYEIGLWNYEASPPSFAVVVYKGGRTKGVSQIIPLDKVVPDGVDASTVKPQTRVMVTFGEFAVDSRGGYLFPIDWWPAKGVSKYVGQSYVKVDPSGDSVQRVPSHLFDARGRYYVGLDNLSDDKPEGDGVFVRSIQVVDENGSQVSSRLLKLPAETRGKDAGKRGIDGRWFADDSGWLFCRRLLPLRPEVLLDSEVTINGEYVIDVFEGTGKHTGRGRIPRPRFDVGFEPTIDRDGNIYFLHFRDRDIQVIKWEKVSD